MAEASAGSLCAQATIYYKCHPKTEVKTVVCLICESVYHTSDFARLDGAIKLSSVLGICNEHHDLDLTSNISKETLCKEARHIVAQIKSNHNLESGKKLLDNLEIISDEEEEEVYENSLKREMSLLRQLNKELTEKNKLLRDLLEKQKNDTNTVKNKTFAEVMSYSKTGNRPKRVPSIIIKNKSAHDIDQINMSVAHYLNKDKAIQTKKVYKKKDEVIVNCQNEESTSKAFSILKLKLADDCEVNKEKVENPKVKVVGINNFEELDDKKMEEDINERNFSKFSKKCIVLHTYKNNKTKLQTALIEMPAELYQSVRESNNKLFVGYQNCRVYDYCNIKPCFNCGRFGHNGLKCNNKPICFKCTGNHKTRECEVQGDIMKCPNCIYSNSKFKTEYKTAHTATDSHECKILQAKIRKFIDFTDYTMQPILPRYVGMAGATTANAAGWRNIRMSTTSINTLNDNIPNKGRNKN